MRTLFFFVFIGVAVLIRRQQLTPKITFSNQVHGNAQRMVKAFKCEFKVVTYHNFVKLWYIEITKLAEREQTFPGYL